MKFTIIDKTNIKVSRLGFGTASLHHLLHAKKRQDLLRAALANGISHFDTAPYYGYGLAEFDLGKVVSQFRDSVTITTKIGLYPIGTGTQNSATVWARKAIGKIYPRISLGFANWQVNKARYSLRESLKRLRTSYVDFLLLHEPNFSLIKTDEFVNWLENERSAGFIRAWGLAGTAENLVPFISQNNPLTNVIQTKDCVRQRHGEFVLQANRDFQFTYGYLSGANSYKNIQNPDKTIKLALTRNLNGCIIISTRQISRLDEVDKIFV